MTVAATGRSLYARGASVSTIARHSQPQEEAMMNYCGIGWRAAVLRQRAGLDQREAAKLVGIDPRTWRKLEAGQGCQTEVVLKIGQAFRCSLDWLVGGREAASARA